MKSNNHFRHGGLTSAMLAVILLILVAMAAIWLIPSLRERVFGRDAISPGQLTDASKHAEPTATTTTKDAVNPQVGTITAVRAKEGMPTFCLFNLEKNASVAVGAKLDVLHAGQAVATLLVESLTEDGKGATARVMTGAAPVVGDTVMLKP
jgi:HAMP domain-containing protein